MFFIKTVVISAASLYSMAEGNRVRPRHLDPLNQQSMEDILAYWKSAGVAHRLAGSLVAMIGFISPLTVSAQDYGLDTPQPIGSFLNGVLPAKVPGSGGIWEVVDAFPSLTFADPVFLTHQPGTGRLFVVEEAGRIWFFDNDPDTSTKTLFLDRRADTRFAGDSGMLNMAFHPEFGQPGSVNREYVYVYYRYTPDQSVSNGSATPAYLRLSRFTVPDGQEVANPASETVLIQQFDRHDWHNGGAMFFGADGFLYLAIGDEGGANDEFDNGQKIDGGLLAGVLRIDVDQDPSRSHPIRRQPQNPGALPTGWPNSFSANYSIPNDNPWVDPTGDTLEEFWAIGLRSPHTMSYDAFSGQVWIGDVGQGSREEVSLLAKGANFQWPYREGSIAGSKAKPAPLIGFDQPPVWDYDRSFGGCVIGGVVYRGSEHATELAGKYLFGDHNSRNLWALTYNEGQQPIVEYLAQVPDSGEAHQLAAFGVDKDGEIFMCKPADSNGRIYKLARTGAILPDPPLWLSQTGAFTNLAALQAAPGIISYDVNTPLWSDGAEKRRWIAVPNNGSHDSAAEQIAFSETGAWRFPIGTVLIKHFEIGTDENNPGSVRRLETRFMVHDEDGQWYGVTYRWLPDGSDAQLLTTALEEDITLSLAAGGTETFRWHYPSRSACFTCHTSAAGHVLGVKTRQLNRDSFYPLTGRTSNQLKTLNHLGIFDPSVNEAGVSNFFTSAAVGDDTLPLEKQARSYIDSNCSQCHRPQGGTQAFFDAVLTTPSDLQNIVNGDVLNDLGISGAKVVVPGDVSKSILYQRANSLGGCCAMPPLAKNRLDATALAVIGDWINNLDPATAPTGVVPSPNGVAFEYFEGSWSTLPDFDSLVPVNTGIASTFDIGLRQREDSFAFRFRGRIRIDVTGFYTFYTNSDDGSRLLIDDNLVVDNDGIHTVLEVSGAVFLPEGLHDFELTMFDGTGDETLAVSYAGPGLPKRIIPSAKLMVPGTAEPDLVSPASTLATATTEVNAPFFVTASFSETVSPVVSGDVLITNGVASNFGGSGSVYSFQVTPGVAGPVSVSISSDSVVDSAGNANTASNLLSVNFAGPDPGSLTVTLASTNPVVGGTFDVTVSFSAPVTGLSAGDFNIVNGTSIGLSGSGAIYTLSLAPQVAGAVTVALPGDAVIDGTGNGNAASNLVTVTFVPPDTTPPSVIISTVNNSVSGPFSVNAVFSEPVSGLELSDIVIGNGSLAGLNGSGAVYSFTVTPEAAGTVTVSLPADSAVDTAGNRNLASNVLTVTNTGIGSEGLVMHLRFDEASGTTTADSSGNGHAGQLLNGVNRIAGRVGQAVLFDGVDDYVFVPGATDLRLGDGNADFTIAFWMDLKADAPGDWRVIMQKGADWNQRTLSLFLHPDSNRAHYRVSTTTQWNNGGDGDLSWPVNTWTHVACTKVGNVLTLYIDGAVDTSEALAEPVIANDGGFYFGSSPWTTGTNVALDEVRVYNRTLSASEILTLAIEGGGGGDTIPPAVTLTTSASQVSDVFNVDAVFSESVTGLQESDFTVVNGTHSNLTGVGASYTFTVNPGVAGDLLVSLPAGSAADAAGNGNTPSNALTVSYAPPDTVPPTVILTTPVANVAEAFDVTAAFSESVSALTVSDFVIGNGAGGTLVGSGGNYTLTVTPLAAGNVTVTLPAGSAVDAAGNGNAASNTVSVTYSPIDVTPTTVVLSTANTEVAGSFLVSTAFSETVVGFDLSDVTVVNGVSSALSGAGASYSFSVTPGAAGQVTVNVPSNTVIDVAGNPNTPSNLLSVTYTESTGGGTAAPGVVAWWAFEEGAGTTASDETGNGNLGVLKSGAQWAAGRIGGGIAFDGIDAVMEVADSAFLRLGDQNDDYTVAFWVKLTGGAEGSWRAMIQKADNWRDRTFSFFLHPDSERVHYRASTTAAWNSGGDSAGVFTLDDWAHVACVKEGATLTLYLNGTVDSSETQGAGTVSNTGTLYLGSSPHNSGAGTAMIIDELQLYQRSLDASEVVSLAAATASSSDAGNDNAFQPTGSGFLTEIFEGTNQEELRLTRVDPIVNFDWGNGSPDASVSNDGFSMSWRGCIRPDFSETYTLYVTADDGVRLWLDGNLEIDRWQGTAAPVTHTVQFAATAQQPVPLRLDYFDSSGSANVRLEWSSVSRSREVIPATHILMNETQSLETIGRTYPKTWTEWVESPYARNLSTSAPSDLDGDGYDDYLEFALGTPVGGGELINQGLRVEHSGDQIAVAFRRPSRLEGVKYVLEASSAMQEWFAIDSADVAYGVTSVTGFETVRYSGLENVPLLSSERGFVRLRVEPTEGGFTCLTPVCAWYRTPLHAGYQTIGVSLVKPALFAGRFGTVDENRVTVAGGGYLPLALDSTKGYYLEIVSGESEGHRFDIDVVGTIDNSISLDISVAHNTKPSLPTGLQGERFVVREHCVLGEVFDKHAMFGTTDPAESDSLLFYDGSGYDGYFLLNAGPPFHLWASTANASLADVGNLPIPPGTGCFVVKAGDQPTEIFVSGEVRSNAFIQNLKAGYNLVAGGYPLTASPRDRAMTLENGFLGEVDPSQADQIQIWNGDTAVHLQGFNGYFLLDAGQGTEFRYWTDLSNAALADQSNKRLFRYDRAAFIHLQENDHPEFRVMEAIGE
ncbi:MAG: putative repeat protein (TIGR03806 family) [Verrucomicrobiales bacterium]